MLVLIINIVCNSVLLFSVETLYGHILDISGMGTAAAYGVHSPIAKEFGPLTVHCGRLHLVGPWPIT